MNHHFLILALWVLTGASISAQHAFVKERTTRVTLENGKLITVEEVSVVITDSQGDSYAEIAIPYQKGDRIDVDFAEVLDAKGKVVKKIKGRDILHRSAISDIAFYDESMILTMDMRWHQYPYEVKYKFLHSESKYLKVDWTPFLYYRAPVLDATLSIKIPALLSYSLYVDTVFSQSIRTEEGAKIFEWKINSAEAILPEPHSSSFLNINPRIIFAPHLFHYGIEGAQHSWSDFGNWYERLNAGRQDLTVDEKRKVHKITDDLEGDRQKIGALYNYLQENTRYVYVSTDIGGLQTHPASYVCENKFGDCKALTNYMQAMLNEIGITAYNVLIYADENPVFIRDQVATSQFNHVILCVPLQSGDTVWLENTMDRIPAGYLGTFTQGRKALLINGKESHLVDIPFLTVDEVLCENRYEFLVDIEKNTGTFSCSLKSRGYWYELDQQYRDWANGHELNAGLATRIHLKDVTITEYKYYDDPIEPRLNIKIQGEVNKPLREIANMFVCSISDLDLSDFVAPERRKTTLQINFPANAIDTFEYKFQSDHKYELAAFKTVNISSVYGDYSISSHIEEDSVKIVRRFILFRSKVGLEEYPNFYQFINAIKKSQSQTKIILKKQKT